jgi:hypothetical protein
VPSFTKSNVAKPASAIQLTHFPIKRHSRTACATLSRPHNLPVGAGSFDAIERNGWSPARAGGAT